MALNDDEEEVEAKGSWAHAAFHVSTTIATPAAYAPLPFALASLSWPLGVSSLVAGTLSTCYSSLLYGGGMATGTLHIHILPKAFMDLGATAPLHFFQQLASLGNNIAIQIAAGSSLKAVYKHYDPNATFTLQHFIIFFGAFQLLLSQFPNIHSLRWLNAFCTLSTIGFASTTIGLTIYNGSLSSFPFNSHLSDCFIAGKKADRSSISYSLQGSSSDRVFGVFNALGAIAFSFGDAMLPEIQSTVKNPVRTNMYKGISSAYIIIAVTYWQLAFLGYWAFGAHVDPYILASISTPKWTIVMANLFAVFQISGCYQIYCRPTYAYFQGRKMPNNNTLHVHDYVYRLVYTSIYIGFITLVSSAMPFFGDFVSICGPVGFTPLDFVFPVLAYMKAGKMPRRKRLRLPLVLINTAIASWFSIVAVLGCIGAVRLIILDTRTYKFFYDM